MDYQGVLHQSLEDEALSYLNESPPCFKFLEGFDMKNENDDTLTVSFPVKPEYCNPAGSMQGGIITAAFDDVFGPLSHICLKTLTTTVNLNTSYHRPIFPGDVLTIRAEVNFKGRHMIHINGEARNKAGKLIATADTSYLSLKERRPEAQG